MTFAIYVNPPSLNHLNSFLLALFSFFGATLKSMNASAKASAVFFFEYGVRARFPFVSFVN